MKATRFCCFAFVTIFCATLWYTTDVLQWKPDCLTCDVSYENIRCFIFSEVGKFTVVFQRNFSVKNHELLIDRQRLHMNSSYIQMPFHVNNPILSIILNLLMKRKSLVIYREKKATFLLQLGLPLQML